MPIVNTVMTTTAQPHAAISHLPMTAQPNLTVIHFVGSNIVWTVTYEKLPESSDIMKTESQLPAQQYKLIYIHTALHPSTWSIVRDNPDILIKLSELYNCYIRQGPVSVSIPCNTLQWTVRILLIV